MFKKFLICVSCVLICVSCVYAQETETLTITTYYPSPFGSYRELRSQRMAIGTTYYDAGTYPWYEGMGCLGARDDQICNANLVVEGNVGIGTRKPAKDVHIFSSTGPELRLESGSDSSYPLITLKKPSSQWELWNYAGDKFNIIYNPPGISTLTIDSSGNVGIGMINPKTKLHIFGPPVDPDGFTGRRGQLSIEGTNGMDNAYITFYRGPLGSAPAFVAGWIGYQSINSTSGKLEIASWPSSAYFVAMPIVFTVGYTERMRITATGNVGIGTTDPTSLLDINGEFKANNLVVSNGLVVNDGDVNINSGPDNVTNITTKIAAFNGMSISGNPLMVTSGASINALSTPTRDALSGQYQHGGHLDLAEDFRAIDCEPADVVVINPDDNESVVKSKQSYDTTVAGVISQEPAFRIGKTDKDGYSPLALAGRVLCKVTTEGGPIKRGDLLVTSSKPGYAMKAEPDKLKPGMVLGKALETLDEAEGKILVLVTLQ